MTAPASPPAPSFTLKDAMVYAATVIIFGSSWLPMRLQLGVVAPEVSGFFRFLLAAPVMFAIAAAMRTRLSFPLRDHLLFAALGSCFFSFNFLAFYYAGVHLKGGLLSVIFSLTALMIPLVGVIAFGQRMDLRTIAGAALGVFGTLLVFGPSIHEAGVSSGIGTGLLLAFAGTCCFTLGSIVSGRVSRRGIPVIGATAWAMLYGLVILVGAVAITGAPVRLDWSARYMGSLVYLTLGPTVLGFLLYMRLIRTIGASRAGYATILFTLVALLVSTVFEDFHWSIAAALGIVLVLAGNVVVLGRKG